jgi:hypothetical protein
MKTEDKKDNLLTEHLRKIKYRVGYKINESPKYRPLVGSNEQFDAIPAVTNEAGEQEDAEKPGGGEVPPAPSNDQPVGMDAPVPAFAETGDTATTGATPTNPMAGDMSMPPVEPEQQVDDVQNDIIKHNIEAMKSIHDQLQSLENSVKGLNVQLQGLNADVEEVREPTNSEKLMSKKNVSYPYYFNLNDFWNGNWFTEKRNEEQEKGIRELPDGSYVADFDDLPQKSRVDIQNSFNEIYESVSKKKVQLKEELDLPTASNGNTGNKSEIDGLPKQTAIKHIYAKISPLSQGFFRDESWENVHKIFKILNEMNLDWYLTKTEYENAMPPKYKIWYFEIDFLGNDGRPKKIMGNLTAAGAGSVEYPLDRYDISVVLS